MNDSERSSPHLQVLIVTHYFSDHGGGIEAVAGQLARRFVQRGASVTWAASDTDDPAANRQAGIRCEPMRSWNAVEKKIGVPFPVWSPRALLHLVQLIRRADIVMFHDILYLPNLIGMVAALVARTPYLIVQHVGFVPFKNPLLRLLVSLGNRTAGRLAMRKAGAVIFISDVVRAYFSRFIPLGKLHCELIANGVDGALFKPSPASGQAVSTRAVHHAPPFRKTFLFVGRFVEKKGLALLQALAEQMRDVKWQFVGWGPIDPRMWGLENVEVLGRLPQEQLPHLYRMADLLVLPSQGEGFPLVVQEAMACGLPVAIATETATALPGVPDVVFHAPVGQPNHDVETWLALLQPLLEGETLAQRRWTAAAFAEKHWSWEGSADRHLRVLLSLVGSKNSK
ncbi:glycosyltransferase family 4 protein [Aquabacterium sp. A7-Y]|uniref:glycosyltransferase family 4 protein n=1 Tax=Aquabacterium sp. A7-Y TaxID=1349605 RepID=UPI00223E05C5|nr:glycosyltransferase family 4 protein [Aquabacterium sp. A7-Y]MCW7538976.1 glycosyltransferase family 4 protein [Aquabacterium sp. A7-Y]